MTTFHGASLLASFFQQHFLTSCLSCISVFFTVSPTFSILLCYICYYIFDQWYLMLLLQLFWHFLSNEAFLTKSCAFFSQTQCYCTLNRIQHTQNFYKNWETHNPMTRCNCSVRFIVVVWNWIHNIPKVCLCLEHTLQKYLWRGNPRHNCLLY